MKSILVQTEPNYQVLIGNKILNQAITHDLPAGSPSFSKSIILCEQQVFANYSDYIRDHLPEIEIIPLSGGEQIKNFEGLASIWHCLIDSMIDRRSLVISVGGGAFLDATAFSCSTFMRGVAFVGVPTTLLSQVDASIGGKNGINFASTKNLIGTIRQPYKVVLDTHFLTSLPIRELVSGVAEMVKHGLVYNFDHFEQVHSFDWQNLFADAERLENLLHDSCKIKSEVVQRDPNEVGLRKILNFGHTVGHALESTSLATPLPLLHGEAIALGMCAELWIANKLNLCDATLLPRVRSALLAVGLPTQFDQTLKGSELTDLLLRDKKNSNGEVKLSLISDFAVPIYDIPATSELILASIKALGTTIV